MAASPFSCPSENQEDQRVYALSRFMQPLGGNARCPVSRALPTPPPHPTPPVFQAEFRVGGGGPMGAG